MSIDRYLTEYRDYLYTKDLMLDKIEDAVSRGDLYIINKHAISLITELLSNSYFIDSNLDEIEDEIKNIYNHIHDKISRLVDIAEGYQNLNSSEIISEKINSFKAFDIKSTPLYNTFLKAITLKNTSNVKNMKPRDISKSNIDATEDYVFNREFVNKFVRIKIKDPDKTIIKRVSIFDKERNLIDTIFSNRLILITEDIYMIRVTTDNEESNVLRYTDLDILDKNYLSKGSVNLPAEHFRKEGSTFKLNSDFNLPTGCYITLKITLSYVDSVTDKIIKETLYTSIDNDKNLIINKEELESLGVQYKESSKKYLLDTNYTTVEELSTDYKIFSKRSYNVLNIKNINTEEFSIQISMDLYSVSNKLYTPEVKGIYGYVTE